MAKYQVIVGDLGDDWIYTSGEWKEEVCEDFDQNVVIVGNRDYPEIEAADWWREADELLSEMDNYGKEEFIDLFSDEYDIATLEQVASIYYDECGGYPDDTINVTARIAMILRPGLHLEQTTIRGSVQSDWDYVVYVAGSIDVRELADWFFGNVFEVTLFEIENESSVTYSAYGDYVSGAYISCTQYWDLEGIDAQKEYFADLFGVSAEDIVAVERP